jgi:histidinol-phosphatase (PHP family)
MRANYHTHCDFCDGRVPAAVMAEAASKAGYSVLGFSSHSPLPFPNSGNIDASRLGDYAAEVRRLALEWGPKGLEILLGLEIEWLPGVSAPRDALFSGMGLDFSIGSVHYVDLPGSGLFTVDEGIESFEAKLGLFEGEDPGRRLYEDYYARLAALAESGGFDILGHFDLVKKNNGSNGGAGRWFDESSKAYQGAAFEAARALRGKDIVAEINVGGISRGKVKTPYPSLPILRELRANRVRITFSADAHAPEHLGAHLEEARELARAAGYDSIAVLTKGKWIEVGIEES